MRCIICKNKIKNDEEICDTCKRVVDAIIKDKETLLEYFREKAKEENEAS